MGISRNPRRHWTTTEKRRIVLETYEPGVSIGCIARLNGIDHHLPRRWRRPLSQATLGESMAKRRCILCNEPVEAARADAKFCSPKCRQKTYRVHKASRLHERSAVAQVISRSEAGDPGGAMRGV